MLTIEHKRPNYSDDTIIWITTSCKIHRRSSIAEMWTDKFGHKYCIYYFLNICHRDSTKGPAYTSYYSNGQKHIEEYIEDGELHRLNGPASRNWDMNGVLNKESFWERGRCIKNMSRKKYN